MIRQLKIISEMIGSLFVSNKQVKPLHIPDIELFILIPGFLRILTAKQLQAKPKNKVVISQLANLKMFLNNTDCKTLFVAKNAELNFMAAMMNPLKERLEQELRSDYFDFVQCMLDQSRERFKKFSRVYTEFARTDITIDGLSFERSEIVTRIPERALTKEYYYQGFHLGYHVIFFMIFKYDKQGSEMIAAIEQAVFKKNTSQSP